MLVLSVPNIDSRHPADKIIEGFAKLIKDKEPEADVVVEASRQVEIEDVKRKHKYVAHSSFFHSSRTEEHGTLQVRNKVSRNFHRCSCLPHEIHTS